MTDNKISLEKIGGFFKSVQGIAMSVISIGTILTTLLISHDTRLKKKFIEDAKNQDDEQTIKNLSSDVSKMTIQFNDLVNTLNAHLKLNKAQDSSFKVLTKSVNALALTVAKTPLEYARIMQGVQFELVQSEEMKSVFPETKIKIIKIPK
jgi:hypothetical protein